MQIHQDTRAIKIQQLTKITQKNQNSGMTKIQLKMEMTWRNQDT